jgi:hypothetical protein
MKNAVLSLLALAAPLSLLSQLPLVYQSASKSKQLGELSRTASLVVVIENEKRPDDAALVDAVKKYWKVGPVKYMSQLEFNEKLKSNSVDESQLYLYNNGSKGEFLESVRHYPTVSMYSGFYLTNNPRKLLSSLKARQAPGYLHFSSNPMSDSRNNPNKGYYSLMIRNFDHDLRFCQDEANLKFKRKIKKRNNISFFVSPDTVASKTTLLVKEQTARQEKQKTKKGKKRQEKRREFVTDGFTNKKVPVVVFPEDVDLAVKKTDKDVVLYSGGCMYAPDGSVYATARQARSGNFSTVVSVASLVISVVSIVVFINR